MNYKVSKTLKDNKTSLIIIAVLWVVLTIVLVAPIGYSIGVACEGGSFDFEIFLEKVFVELASFTSFTKIFSGFISACTIFFFASSLNQTRQSKTR